MRVMLDENCASYNGPMYDLANEAAKSKNESGTRKGSPKIGEKRGKGGKRREQNFIVRDMVTCLGLCHNVTPTYPDPNDKSIREF